jgi:hypothetical protein
MSRPAQSEMTTPVIVATSVERCLALLDAVARGENVAAAMFEAVAAIQRGCQD